MIKNLIFEYDENDKIKKLFTLKKNEKTGNIMIFFNFKLMPDFENVHFTFKRGFADLSPENMDLFMKYMNKKYKTIHKFLSFCVGTDKADIRECVWKAQSDFIRENLLITTSLYNYYNEFEFDKEKTEKHDLYDIEFPFNHGEGIRGTVKFKIYSIKLDHESIRVFDNPMAYGLGTNDIHFNIKDEETLKTVQIKYFINS